MQIEAKFFCPEIVGHLRNGTYIVPESATISDLMEISRSEYSDQVSENMLDCLLILRNGKPARLDTELFSGDKIHVLRKIMGG